MALEFQYWKHKKSGETFAVKLKDGLPFRKYGPLKEIQYISSDGRLLTHKLERFHYDHRFEDDPFGYILIDGI
ncbi:MAG: hypothetical protein COA73_14360 [Candidatus Hydrogenedentota bacterium]|nr:MAG: hypothetical protein COA73_14360 [Candidatus Hydrogenedentota bacterium]